MPDLSYPLINGNYSSANSAMIKLAGLQFVGIKALEYDDDLKPGDVRGFHARIIGRTTGTESAKGSVELFLPEFVQLQDALKLAALARFGGTDGWKQVEFNIMASIGELGGVIVQDELIACRITSVAAGFSSGSADALTRKCGLSIVNIKWNGVEGLAFPLAGVPFLASNAANALTESDHVNGRLAAGSPPRTPGGGGGPPIDYFDEAVVDDALDNLRATLGAGNVVAVQTIRGWAIFRSPTATESMRYKTLLNDEKTKTTASGILARVVVVWPARETFDGWATEKPLIADEVSGAILELAGLTGKAATKK